MSRLGDDTDPPHPGDVATPGRGEEEEMDVRDEREHQPLPVAEQDEDVYEDASDAGEVLFRRRPLPDMQPPPAPPRVSPLPAMKPEQYDGTSDWSEYLIYYEQLAELSNWNDEQKAVMLSLALRGEARVVLASLEPAKRRSYRALTEALSHSFAPTEMMYLHRAELKARKRRPNESMIVLGRDIAKMIRQAYPTADVATRETLGINAFLEALPGPASEMKLHIIKGRPRTLQEAVAHATEVHAVLEAESKKESRRRGDVRMVKGSPDDEIENLKEELTRTKEALSQLQKENEKKRKSREIVCYGCGRPGHIRRHCREAAKKPVQGNGEGRQD